jgi:hypothetical protein
MVTRNSFSSREAVSPIKMIIWNKEPLMGFEIASDSRAALYVSLAAVS